MNSLRRPLFTLLHHPKNRVVIFENGQRFHTSPFRPTRGGKLNEKPKIELEPHIKGIHVETGQVDPKSLWKPLVFTLGFSAASLTGAAIWNYENMRARSRSLVHSTSKWFKGQLNTHNYSKWRSDLNKWWSSLPESEKLFIPICAANVLVFLAWRAPALQPTMVKYFCSNPASKAVCWPMVLSTFSHYSGLHLCVNMYVLHSFFMGSIASMGKEQFLGFYLTAGVLSSFTSCIHKVLMNKPGLSLGASGAIMGVLGYVCTKFPDIDLGIVFLPFFTFKAFTAIKAMIAIDAAGILMGWRFFDHAAHLGGALFGIFWASWGSSHIWHRREAVVQAWHSIRDPPKH